MNLFLHIIILSALLPCTNQAIASEKSDDDIRLYWTDRGITPWLWGERTKGMKIGDTFEKWNIPQVIPDLEKEGQILIPMPSDEGYPETEKEWTNLYSRLLEDIKSRVNVAVRSGVRDFEIQVVQNINIPGYFDSSERQPKVIAFIKIFSTVLNKVKEEITKEGYDVRVHGIWGSNGGNVAARVIPELEKNPVDKGLLVDARAWEDDVRDLYKAIKKNLIVINTAGDAPASPISALLIDEKMVAHHDTAKKLKEELPELRVIWVDVEGLDISILKHLSSIGEEAKLQYKEYTGNGYTKPTNLSKKELLKSIGIITPITKKKKQSSVASYPSLSQSLETSILRGEWEEVIEELGKDEGNIHNPVATYILAHAALATNRNNASFLLFYSLKKEEEFRLCAEWTSFLSNRNKENLIANYLAADAKVRKGQLDEAIKMLESLVESNQELTKSKDSYKPLALIYNVLGVAYLLSNEWDLAEVSFYIATNLDPKLADAYANKGALGVLRESSESVGTGTKDDLNKAITLNPNFAIAYNSRGAYYFGNGRFEKAAEDFKKSSEIIPFLPTVRLNQTLLSAINVEAMSLASILEKTTRKKRSHALGDVLSSENITENNFYKNIDDISDLPDEFWDKLETLYSLPEEQRKSLLDTLIQEYGLHKVRLAIFSKREMLVFKNEKIKRKIQELNKEMGPYIGKILIPQLAEALLSVCTIPSGVINTLREKGFILAVSKTGVEVAQSSIGDSLDHLGIVISSIPFTRFFLNSSPGSLAISIVTSALGYALKLSGHFALEEFNERSKQMLELYAQSDISAKQMKITFSLIRNVCKNAKCEEIDVEIRAEISRHVLFALYNKDLIEEIKNATAKGLSKKVNLKDENKKYYTPPPCPPFCCPPFCEGFALAVPPDDHYCGPSGCPPDDHDSGDGDDPTDKHDGDDGGPPDDPDNFRKNLLGLLASDLPHKSGLQNYLPSKKIYYKPFKLPPGGVSTEEIARAYVDKGNWPVLTSFGLVYNINFLQQ